MKLWKCKKNYKIKMNREIVRKRKVHSSVLPHMKKDYCN